MNMEYNKIIAVTGLPGLYELLSSKSDGAIVRSLDDKTTRFVSSRIHNFSHLESIEVYTVRDNVNLVDILKAMEASSTKLPDEKDGSDLKAYFTKVYPDLDFARVYSSDLKKMVKWFSVLKANNIEIKLSEPEEGEESAAGAEEVAKEPPAPKPAPKKKEEKAATAQKAEPADEKPKAKKAAAVADAPVAKKAAASAKVENESNDNSRKSKSGKTEKVKKAEEPAGKPKKAAKKK
ncbi:MAG TPA: DUF5606 domain-containing protein [Puia sp.]|jgi:hypothetical protein|nr:DUF5606 domain-containing protein [Puia sp.]